MAFRSLRTDLTTSGLELVETHISWVFLDERDVWKVKKPVDFGFLDFTTADKRRRACEAEVELNRRLAPDVYLGVVPITRDEAGRHELDGDGETVDWAVHMRRLPDADRADVRLADGRLATERIDDLAARLAVFHARSRCDEETASYGSVDAIGRNVHENFEQTRDTVNDYLTAEQAEEIEEWQRRFLTENAQAFAARIDSGKVRDGHGDLRLEHVYFDHRDRPPTVIDCIEFNERFRFADVCADVAFLAMDLAWHGRVDLAERLLAAYAREANDYDLYPLVDFYESYRAYVRGKVATMLAADVDADTAARERAGAEARRYFLLALASERRPLLRPAVVAVGGLIAAGKSTVAQRIAAELSAPVVGSDRTRKHLLGVEPEVKVHVPAWRKGYTPERTAQVYEEVLRRGAAVLRSQRPVVLDASFRSRHHRKAARRLAADHGVPFTFVECRTEIEILKERLRRRAQTTSVSDGRLEILDDFAASWQPVDELPASEYVMLDTSRSLDDNVELLRDRMPTWPTGLVQ